MWTTKSPTLRSRRSERNAFVAERRRSGWGEAALNQLRRLGESRLDEIPVGHQLSRRKRPFVSADRLVVAVQDLLEKFRCVRFNLVALGDDDSRRFRARKIVEESGA